MFFGQDRWQKEKTAQFPQVWTVFAAAITYFSVTPTFYHTYAKQQYDAISGTTATASSSGWQAFWNWTW
jgi:hypothetical protein